MDKNTEKKYADGLWNNPRKENQPDFVLANVSFHAERFAKWIVENQNEKGYIYFQILNGNEGAYLKYDDWKPKTTKAQDPTQAPIQAPAQTTTQSPMDERKEYWQALEAGAPMKEQVEINADDIPF